MSTTDVFGNKCFVKTFVDTLYKIQGVRSCAYKLIGDAEGAYSDSSI